MSSFFREQIPSPAYGYYVSTIRYPFQHFWGNNSPRARNSPTSLAALPSPRAIPYKNF